MPDAGGTDDAKAALAAPLSAWCRQIAAELGLSPDLPGEAVIVAAAKAAADPAGPRGPALEELAEDCRSFNESLPYCIRRDEAGDPIACECCGTLVALTARGGRASGRLRRRGGTRCGGASGSERTREHLG